MMKKIKIAKRVLPFNNKRKKKVFLKEIKLKIKVKVKTKTDLRVRKNKKMKKHREIPIKIGKSKKILKKSGNNKNLNKKIEKKR